MALWFSEITSSEVPEHQGLSEFVSGPRFNRIVETTRNQHFFKHYNMAPLTRIVSIERAPDRGLSSRLYVA